jgi:uncharacterized protein YndB with AHSA1/START domain
MSDTADTVTVERTIKAEPSAIFELLADPSKHCQIDGSGSVRDAKEGSTRLSMGAKFGMSMKLGMPYSMSNEVIEFDEPKRIAWQTHPPSSVGAKLSGGRIWRYELEPTDGGTIVRETWDVSQEKQPIKALLRLGRTRDHTRKAMDATLAKIEQIVTGSATPSS